LLPEEHHFGFAQRSNEGIVLQERQGEFIVLRYLTQEISFLSSNFAGITPAI